MSIYEHVKYDRLPWHMQDGARLYVEAGIVTGGFLRAVLENNLTESFGRADDVNSARMFAWAMWLYNDAPSECWGSAEKVEAWKKARQDETQRGEQIITDAIEGGTE